MRDFKVDSDVLFGAELDSERTDVKAEIKLFVLVIDVIEPSDTDFTIKRNAGADVTENKMAVISMGTDVVKIHRNGLVLDAAV